MGYQYALHQHKKRLREEKDNIRRSQENNSMSSGAYWDEYSEASESSGERHKDPKHNRRTTAWAREENHARGISAHPSDDEEDFVQETPEAALVVAQAYLLITQLEPGDPREHMHQAAIRSLGLVEGRLRKHPPEKKMTHYEDKGKENIKYQSSQSQASDSSGDEKCRTRREDARNIIAQTRVDNARYAWKEENYEDDEKEMGALCFTRRVCRMRVPKGFKLPHDQQKYDGSQEPKLWLSDYLQAVQILRGTRSTAMQSLQLHLTGATRSWLSTLPNDSIGSWGELESQFTRNFCSTYKRPASLEEVKSCIQRKDKTLRSYIQWWSIIKNSMEDVSDERAVDTFSAGLRRSDLVEELGRTRPRTVLELMEVANRFVDREEAYNNKRARSPEVDIASRQRRMSRNEDSRTRRNQIAVGYERRDEEGHRSREFQNRNSHEKEKPKYSGPSVEDMLNGPCRIHYAYLDGKRFCNHQMKDCRIFLRLQNALELNQGAHRGGTNTSQGYQVQRLARHLESKVYIFAMIQPVPKSKKEQKSISRQVNLAISSPPATTEYLRWSDQPVRFSRADHPRKVPRPGHAPMGLKAQIGGYDTGRVFMDVGSGKLNICKDSKGNEHLAGKPEADRLLFPWNSTRNRKLPPRESRTRRFFWR
jgi:hypothetical protein